MPKNAPARRRITLDLDTGLYGALEALAADERRELKAQLLVILERAVRMHQGQKRSRAEARARRDMFRRGGEES